MSNEPITQSTDAEQLVADKVVAPAEAVAPEASLAGEAKTPASSTEPIDLLGNGKVVKTVLREGSGDYPQNGATVSVHYTGTLEDGTKFDSSLDRNAPFEFCLGSMRVIKGWEVCVASMRKGEHCRVRLHPDFAYGEAGSPPTIPPNATLIFEIELLTYNTRKERWAMSCDEKLTAAAELKEEGTSNLKEKNFSGAAHAYNEAAALMEKLEDWPEDQQSLAQAMYISCKLNLALAQIKLENWIEVTVAASAVLAVDPKNCKALYRRALARSHLDDYDHAELDFAQALLIEPENSEIKRASIENRKRRIEANNKVKALYKKMF